MGKPILIFGDYSRDIFYWPIKRKLQANNPNYKHYNYLYQYEMPGGTEFLGLIVKNCLNAIYKDSQPIVDYWEFESSQKTIGKDIPNSINILEERIFPKCGDSSNKKFFRVNSNLGYIDNNISVFDLINNFKTIFEKNRHYFSLSCKPIIVLNDFGFLIRNNSTFIDLLKQYGKESIIILKNHKPLFSGKLWEMLSREFINKQLFVIINSNDLRNFGIHLSRGLSWEKVLCDFVDQFFDEENKLVETLKIINHLIICFDIDGILYLNKTDTNNWLATIIYDPQFTEGGNKDSYNGFIPGLMSSLTGGFAAKLSELNLIVNPESNEEKSENYCNIIQALKYGFYLSHKLHSSYFEFSLDTETFTYPFQDIINSKSIINYPCVKIHLAYNNYFRNLSYWSIINESGSNYIKREAFKIVKSGLSYIKKDIPYAEFGDYITFDRDEIENYNEIEKIFNEFVNSKETKICAIAAFGPPGCGKSFGIKGLATKLDPNKFQQIIINLSQLESQQNLTKEYQDIRNISLKGKIPIVFFDEFDSTVQKEQYGWLKSFLAPIQDGEFTDEQGTHPIGKAIFVFAGGTKKTIQEFIGSPSNVAFDKRVKNEEKFKSVKGPDFISRLTGFVNVRGPNRYDADDSFWVIRRAILLRHFLEKYMPKIFDLNKNANIDNRIINSLLFVPEYYHGSRSMEAIIRMSSTNNKDQFDRSDLPSLEQLNLHIKGDWLIKQIQQPVIDNFQFVDNIAKNTLIVMKDYHKSLTDYYSDHYWYELDWDNFFDKGEKEPFLRDSEFLLEIISILGYEYIIINDIPDNSHFLESVKQLKPKLKKKIFNMEHDRWLIDRVSLGWIFSNNHLFGTKNYRGLLPLSYIDNKDSTTLDYIKNYFYSISKILENSNICIKPKNLVPKEIINNIKNNYSKDSFYIHRRNKELIIESEYHINILADKLHNQQIPLMKKYLGTIVSKDEMNKIVDFDYKKLPPLYKEFFTQWAKKICEDLAYIDLSVIPYIAEKNKAGVVETQKIMYRIFKHNKHLFHISSEEEEYLGKQVHNRWYDFLMKNNWTLGTKSNYNNKQCKYLTTYTLLNEDIIKSIRKVTRSYPQILMNSYFIIYKLGKHSIILDEFSDFLNPKK